MKILIKSSTPLKLFSEALFAIKVNINNNNFILYKNLHFYLDARLVKTESNFRIR